MNGSNGKGQESSLKENMEIINKSVVELELSIRGMRNEEPLSVIYDILKIMALSMSGIITFTSEVNKRYIDLDLLIRSLTWKIIGSIWGATLSLLVAIAAYWVLN